MIALRRSRMFELVFVAALLASPMASAGGPSTEEQATASEIPAFEVPNSEVHEIRSTASGRTYFAYVKLPSGYHKDENQSRSYPVIYLNDGPYTFQVASGLTHLSMRVGAIEEAIVVGISFAEGETGQASRTRDLTPTVSSSDRFKDMRTGGAADYLSFLEAEFMPIVEQTYRIDSAQRTLVGQSFGGLFGFYVLLTKPELFESYVLTSTSFWYGNRGLFDMEEAYSQANRQLRAKVYLAVGEFESPTHHGTFNEMVGDQTAFVRALKSRNYQGLVLRADIVEGTGHHTTFPMGLTRGLLWILPGSMPKK